MAFRRPKPKTDGGGAYNPATGKQSAPYTTSSMTVDGKEETVRTYAPQKRTVVTDDQNKWRNTLQPDGPSLEMETGSEQLYNQSMNLCTNFAIFEDIHTYLSAIIEIAEDHLTMEVDDREVHREYKRVNDGYGVRSSFEMDTANFNNALRLMGLQARDLRNFLLADANALELAVDAENKRGNTSNEDDSKGS